MQYIQSVAVSQFIYSTYSVRALFAFLTKSKVKVRQRCTLSPLVCHMQTVSKKYNYVCYNVIMMFCICIILYNNHISFDNVLCARHVALQFTSAHCVTV